MKITAKGFSRSVVGTHTITDQKLSDQSFSPTDDGVEIYVSISNILALSGHFRVRVYLSTEELRQAMHSATIQRLEKRIEYLEAKLANI